MKRFCFLVWALGALIWISPASDASAQTNGTVKLPSKTSPGTVDFAPELNAVTAQLKAKFEAGKTNAAELKASLKEINELIAKHIRDGNREQVARLYLLDAHIYADGLDEKKRARAIWSQVLRDFPNTLAAKGAWVSLGLNAPEGLEVGQRFPDFNETDVAGNPLSVSAYQGRVTLIDFWATWCGPCRQEMPNVISTYQTFHAQGFEIIGVSLDTDRDSLVKFTQSSGMPWPQYFDGQEWQNKLAQKYAVNAIPMNYLLSRYGIIIGKNLRGDELSAAVNGALAAQ